MTKHHNNQTKPFSLQNIMAEAIITYRKIMAVCFRRKNSGKKKTRAGVQKSILSICST